MSYLPACSSSDIAPAIYCAIISARPTGDNHNFAHDLVKSRASALNVNALISAHLATNHVFCCESAKLARLKQAGRDGYPLYVDLEVLPSISKLAYWKFSGIRICCELGLR